MARKENVEVTVDLKPKGMGELKAKWADFAGDLLEPVVMLAAGATKVQAAWAGVRGMFEARVLGPLGLVAGASIGFLATTRMLVGQWKVLGMTAAGALERMTLQFRPLLGSLDRAKERVAQLSNFAVKTPFEIDEIVEANKMLEVLTQGALATDKGMTLVGDAASVAGQAFSDTARMVGRLYDGLMSGRPVGEATMRLQEMGIISGSVRNQIESMQAANASGLEIWKVVEKQLARNSGAMDAQSKSLEGLQSTWADTKNQMEGGFSSGFLEGEKSGVAASIKLMEAMTPVLKTLGKETGAVENSWAALKLRVVDGVTSWKGFGGTVEWVIKGMVGLAAVLAGASTMAITGFTINLLKLIAGNKAAASSAAHLAAVESASIPAMTKLVAVKNSLQAASKANAAGLRAEAGAHLGAAAAGMKNMLSTNGLVGAVGVGKKAMMGLGMALRFVGVQMRVMAVALLANPLVWLVAIVAGAVAVFSKLAAVQKEANERLEGYLKATAALDSGMAKQISDIRTLVDLRQAENKILSELVGAYKSVETAQTSADKAAAAARVVALKERLKTLPGTGGLERTDAELALERGQRDGARGVRDFGRDALAAKGPEESLAVAEERLAEMLRLRKEALDLQNEESAAESRAAAIRQAAVDSESERQRLLGKRAQLEQEIQDIPMGGGRGGVLDDITQPLADAQAELDQVQAKLKEMATMPEANALKEMLASPSELQQLKAKIAVMDQLKAAADGVAAAQDAAAQNTDETQKGTLADAVAAAKAAEKQAGALASQAGVNGLSPRGRQSMVTRRDELEAQRGEDMDPLREAEAAKARKDAELAVAQARLDAEAGVASLRLKGFEREERLLAIEQEKLRIRYQADAIGRDQYEREQAILAERQAALQKDGAERRDELATAYEISRLRRAEEEARLAGDPAKADALRQAAEARDDARTRVDAERDAREAGGTPEERAGYVAARVKEAQDARAAERKRAEEERGAGRSRSLANQGSALAGMEADLLKRQGKSKEARAAKERAAREQDELDRVEADKRFREQGFSATDAGRMANTEVKTNQASRLMEELTGQKGNVVASSLAKVGGGGNVAGTDPNTRTLERMEQLLRDIRDSAKENLTEEEF